MRAELLAVGEELLYGDILNANAAWLGRELSGLGVDVDRSMVVGDAIEAIATTVGEALGRCDVVVITGGLGPTQDDLTREALARVAGVPLERDAYLESVLRRRLRGRAAPASNWRQADLPRGAQSLPNEVGTAPGLALTIGPALVVALPGPPHEMQAMFARAVRPLLARRGGSGQVIVHRTLLTTGLWESAVADALAPEVDRIAAAGNPVVAFLAGQGLTRVKITARAPSRPAAELLIAPVERFARQALGAAVFGTGTDSLEQIVIRALTDREQSLACAESLTGGLLTARLTAVPGASAVVRGAVVAYATAAKADQLGVPPELLATHGAVSEATARAMARGARNAFGATFGLALTGVAGPDPQEGKPAGTVHLALAGPTGADSVHRLLALPGDRERVRELAAVAAVDLLRRVQAGLAAAATGDGGHADG